MRLKLKNYCALDRPDRGEIFPRSALEEVGIISNKLLLSLNCTLLGNFYSLATCQFVDTCAIGAQRQVKYKVHTMYDGTHSLRCLLLACQIETIRTDTLLVLGFCQCPNADLLLVFFYARLATGNSGFDRFFD